MPKKAKPGTILPKSSARQEKAPLAPVPPVPAPAPLSLTEDENTLLRASHKKLLEARAALVDACLQAAALEARRNSQVTQVVEAQNAFVTCIKELARARGVDPESKPVDGKPSLTFDIDTFTFRQGG